MGITGEELAAKFLAEKGQVIVKRNFRARGGEIDIITADGNGIHFVEVKTRRPPVMAAPTACVDSTKQRRIVRTAQKWLSSEASEEMRRMECSFDIVGVTFGADGGTEVEYIRQAFVPVYV